MVSRVFHQDSGHQFLQMDRDFRQHRAHLTPGDIGISQVLASQIHQLGQGNNMPRKTYANRSPLLKSQRRSWTNQLHLLRQDRHFNSKHHGIQEIIDKRCVIRTVRTRGLGVAKTWLVNLRTDD